MTNNNINIMMREESIINGCLQSDRSSQRALYELYRKEWYMICLRYIKNQTEALDVLQNALVKIYTKLNTFDINKGSFKAWSGRVVVNECIMYQRKYWRKDTVSLPDIETLKKVKESVALDNLSVEEITVLIKDLPDGYRMVFNMYVLDGYSHKEIAKKLSITEGTSKSQLFKAKKLLKRKLEDIYNQDQTILSQKVKTI